MAHGGYHIGLAHRPRTALLRTCRAGMRPAAISFSEDGTICELADDPDDRSFNTTRGSSWLVMNARPMRNTPPRHERPSHVNDRPIRVFVHLAYGFGAKEWERRWKQGKVIGINEP